MLAAIAFYVLAAIAVISAFAVIAARNPVHSVLFLILTFFTSAGLFVLLGAEFLAMLLVVVYVGAVAVLFLFVVMMLDVDFVELKQGFLDYLPLGALVALALFAELGLVGSAALSANGAPIALQPAASAGVTNAEAIGRILYTDYILTLPIGWPGSPRRHDRRHCLDAAPPSGRPPPKRERSSRPQTLRGRRA